MSRPRSTPPIVVSVLGMHRSGTSISTRGLECLGVKLGDDLEPGGENQNPTGYFESRPLHAICERVLAALGTRWDALDLRRDEAFLVHDVEALRAEAARVLRAEIGSNERFGFKNPRTARLLPFWRDVYRLAEVDDRYLFVIRHPLSVARSLADRDDFDPTKSLLLWLLHAVDGVLGVRKRPIACVDYDDLMADPRLVLTRVGAALGLGEPDEEATRRFAADLIDDGLRHSRFEHADLDADPNVIDLVKSADETLRACSGGEADIASPETRRVFQRIKRRLEGLGPLLAFADSRDRAVLDGMRTIRDERAERARLFEEHERELRERDTLIHERDALIHEKDTLLSERDETITQRESLIEQRDGELVHVKFNAGTQAASLHEAQERIVTILDQAGHERRERVREFDALNDRLGQGLEQIENLRTELAAQRVQAEGDLARADEQREALGRERDEAHDAERRARAEARERELAERAAVARLEEQIALDATRTADWFHTEVTRQAQRLVQAADAFAETRTWHVSRSLQQTLDRLRMRRIQDASEHLRALTRELKARAERRDIEARALYDFTALVDHTTREILAGRIFRTVRSANRFAALARRSGAPGAGPAESLAALSTDLNAFAQKLSAAPLATAVARPLPQGSPDGVGRTVDIVIPVYGDQHATLDCIASVRRACNELETEIVVIDDETPEPALAAELDALEADGAITLLRNERNLGFPASANRGLALHPDRDVVLLNADTRVQGDWVDRLRAAAYSDWNVATATPFSNNAEICSYPDLCRAAPYPSVSEQERIDGALAKVNTGRTLTIPTAMGFCMYLRRSALREVGPFDTMRFQRGYGEENDLCMRMRKCDLRHVLAADVFVAHAGGLSFGPEKARLIEQGLEKLAELHPEYESEVQEFIAIDPVRALRARADASLLPRNGEPTILFVSHAHGGGTTRHVDELAAALSLEGTRVLLLTPEPSGQVRLQMHSGPPAPNLVFDPETELDALVHALRWAGVSHVHFHHRMGHPDSILGLPRRLDVTYDVTAHDYFAICPRVHLLDESGVYCGEPSASVCNGCVSRNGSPLGHSVDVAAWREGSRRFLAGARRVYVPSEDAHHRLANAFEDVHWLVRPHVEAPFDGAPAAARPGRGGRRIAIIGAIGDHKGSEVLLDCARDAAERKLPLTFVVVGYTDRDEELLATKRVEITGAYDDKELPALLKRARCQLAFIPSVWPETYCYTLSGALRAQLMPLAFDLGAVADRIRAIEFGELLPLDSSPAAINDRLLETLPGVYPRDRIEAHHTGGYASCLKDYYDGLRLDD